MRPLSFTKNVGGFKKVFDAIRLGYVPGETVGQFRSRCGLGMHRSLIVTEFFLCTQIQDGEERIVADTLVTHTLSQPFSRLTARLYFFALNLNMPGERLDQNHRSPASIQNTLARQYLYVEDGFQAAQFDKDGDLEPNVTRLGDFQSTDARRKWVTNYWYMAHQCEFVTTPYGRLETFADTWGALALRLFFERFSLTNPAPDASSLTAAAQRGELHKLIGVPRSWLDSRVDGAADIFLSEQVSVLAGFEETEQERRAAADGAAPPPPGGETERREATVQRIVRRNENRQFLRATYTGECQLSGVRLWMPDGSFSVDCAHIRPLGAPHSGPDDVKNMLSLSPTMHRLFDRGCVRIDPDTLTITLLYGNNLPHNDRLVTLGQHVVSRDHLAYHATKILSEAST